MKPSYYRLVLLSIPGLILFESILFSWSRLQVSFGIAMAVWFIALRARVSPVFLLALLTAASIEWFMAVPLSSVLLAIIFLSISERIWRLELGALQDALLLVAFAAVLSIALFSFIIPAWVQSSTMLAASLLLGAIGARSFSANHLSRIFALGLVSILAIEVLIIIIYKDVTFCLIGRSLADAFPTFAPLAPSYFLVTTIFGLAWMIRTHRFFYSGMLTAIALLGLGLTFEPRFIPQGFLTFHPAIYVPLIVILVCTFQELKTGINHRWERAFCFSAAAAALIALISAGIFSAATIVHASRQSVPSVSNFKVPREFVQQLLCQEDFTFFFHSGVDYAQVEQSIRANISHGGLVRGASTISMQLAKLLYLGKEKTFMRKFMQTVLALYLERRFGKDWILKTYVGLLDFGLEAPGITVAARKYFSKDPDQLSADESMLLVLTVPNPKHFNPRMAKPLPPDQISRIAWINARVSNQASRLNPDLDRLSFIR